MCGLAGIFDSRSDKPVDQDLLTVMTDSLGHRGPDGAGYYTGDGVGFGHRRLSIIDLAIHVQGARQKLSSCIRQDNLEPVNQFMPHVWCSALDDDCQVRFLKSNETRSLRRGETNATDERSAW